LEGLVKLKYRGEEIPFELIEYSDCYITCLIVDDEAEEEGDGAEEEFEELGEDDTDDEDEDDEDCWYLDENGERLEPEALFAASPWSLETPEGEIKLLRRFTSATSAGRETHFDTLYGYGGETFKWLHSRPPS
jgi:hypothetical protein